MRLRKSLELALNILVHSKLRSWLTIIGIIIGIGSVVAIVSISQGAQQQLEEQMGGLGADLITISPGASRAMGVGGEFRGGGPPGFGGESSSEQKNLTSKDVVIINGVSNVKYVMGTVSGKEELSFSSKTKDVSIEGVDTLVWDKIITADLVEGRYLSTGDSNSIVIGDRVAESFDDEIQLSRTVTINGRIFRVVGILGDENSVYMPIDVARDILEDVGDKEFSSITVKVENVETAQETTDLIEEKLLRSRGILQEKDKDFSVSSMQAMQETISETMNTLALFLGAIAAISLLVGGIGIANTLFTSVLEKTKEIGIMKSIGARNKDILIVFLFNAGLIGLVGGIGGIILGAIGSSFISALSSGSGGGMINMFGNTALSPSLLIGALLFSILVGMIAGAIPAYRASKLNPVDALRYE